MNITRWKKCKHAYLVEAFKILGKQLDINVETKLNLKKIEADAEMWADMSMRDTRNLAKNATLEPSSVPEPTNIPIGDTSHNIVDDLPIEEMPF
jgi:hypothetical protein